MPIILVLLLTYNFLVLKQLLPKLFKFKLQTQYEYETSIKCSVAPLLCPGSRTRYSRTIHKLIIYHASIYLSIYQIVYIQLYLYNILDYGHIYNFTCIPFLSSSIQASNSCQLAKSGVWLSKDRYIYKNIQNTINIHIYNIL